MVSQKVEFVILTPSLVILSPALVILSEAKDLVFSSGYTPRRISHLVENPRFFASLRMTITSSGDFLRTC
jgi:hypothetical protein